MLTDLNQVSYENVVSLIHKSTAALDSENFNEFLNLCDIEFHYQITTYSPEIKKEMVWMDQDYNGIKSLFIMIPEHLRKLGSFLRQVSVGVINQNHNCVNSTSTFSVIHTDPRGKSTLFVVGRYFDEIVKNENRGLLLRKRRVHLETRDLGIGSHIPI